MAKKSGDKSGAMRAIQKIGKWFGAAKKKDPDTYDAWADMCRGNDWNLKDRMLQLMAFDLKNEGMDLAFAGSVKQEMGFGKTAQKLNQMQELSDIAEKSIVTRIQDKQEHADQVSKMQQDYNAQMGQLQNTMSQIVGEVQKLKEQEELVKGEAQRIDQKERDLQIREQSLKKQKK